MAAISFESLSVHGLPSERQARRLSGGVQAVIDSDDDEMVATRGSVGTELKQKWLG